MSDIINEEKEIEFLDSKMLELQVEEKLNRELEQEAQEAQEAEKTQTAKPLPKKSEMSVAQKEELELIKKHEIAVQAKLKALELPTDEKGYTLDVYGNAVHMANDRKLKKPGTLLPLTQAHIDEIIKCRDDIEYFIKWYVQIPTPLGFKPMVMREYQSEMVQHLQNNTFSMLVATRQSGKSTISNIVTMHKLMFGLPENGVIGITSYKLSLCAKMIDSIKQMMFRLPIWLQIGIVYIAKTFVTLEGNRQLVMDSIDSGLRGWTCSHIVVEEAAFLSDDAYLDFESAIIPTLSTTNGSMSLITTPNGKNFFYEKWTKATAGESEWANLKIEMHRVPGRDSTFKERMLKTMPPQQFAQEYECDFIGSSYTLVPGAILDYLEKQTLLIEPINYSYQIEGIKQFEKPQKDHTYIISVDGAKDGIDDLTVHVIDVTAFPFKQVVSAKLQIEYLRMPFYVYNIAIDYNEALVIVENNEGAGQSITDSLETIYEYENLYRDYSKSYTGFRTTSKSRNLILSTLKMFIEKEYILIQDYLVIKQLSVFVDNGKGKYEAAVGKQDDLVMGLAVALAPFINMKDFNNYHQIMDIIDRNNKLMEKEKENTMELLSQSFFSDNDINDEEFNAIADDFNSIFSLDDAFDTNSDDDTYSFDID